MPLTTRLATTADAGAVAEIHVAGWQAGYRGLLPDAHLDGLRVRDRVAGWADALTDGPTVLVAQDRVDGADRVTGFVTCAACRDDDVPGAGEVQALYVHPDLWGRGVGGELLRVAVATLERAGHRTHVLWTLHDNGRARRFYERQGWMADGARKTDHRPGLVLHEVRYRLTGSTEPHPAEPTSVGSEPGTTN